jgi:conjugal transfer pilus assembly protein TraF
MSVSNNDPKAVEAFQYYMRWVIERSSQVTNLWWYNMVQNPELDPQAAQPVSAMGLRLMTDVQKGAEKEIFDVVRDEGGMFVFFSRNDCAFCHQMWNPLRMLRNRTNLPIRNAALDDQCIPQLAEGCMAGGDAVKAAQVLQVTTVPAVFLYVQPNTWIRVATGFTDTEAMTQRAMQFFSAYRNALLKGVDNGQKGRPSVDFGGEGPTGNKETGIRRETTPEQTEAIINDMLGKK